MFPKLIIPRMIPTTTAETILVVDDCPPVCELIEIILCRAGYRVVTATSGTEALRLARRVSSIDLLVSNTEMPEMSGAELAERIATLHPSAPVLFTSGFENEPARGPFTFLAKPFTIAELRGAVSRALQMHVASAEPAHAA